MKKAKKFGQRSNIGSFILVITTTDSVANADRISKTLIEKRLAACVQIIPGIKSRYRWKGKIVTSKEWLICIKSKKSLFKKLERAITALHSYTAPEIIAVSVVFVGKKYAAWLESKLLRG